MLTKEQLLEHNIWVADNFDEEFITRFKLGQKILVTFEIDGRVYYELLILEKYNHHFYDYKLPQNKFFNVLVTNDSIFEYRCGLYTKMLIKELSLDWLNNFIEWGKNF